eukprot:1287172-Pleurochrysis_carterae.AAC.1
MEGKAAHAGQMYADEWSCTQALNLRLSESLHGSWRVWGADAHSTSVDDVGCMLLKGNLVYMLDDIKGHTRCYPVITMKEYCGTTAGDWAVISSKLDTGHAIWAISHRHGREVHMYITLCRTTLPGRPQLHTEDQADGTRGVPRPCWRVLKDWTKMQPAIEDANRRRQNILAFEKRFITHAFPFCLLTTMIGV